MTTVQLNRSQRRRAAKLGRHAGVSPQEAIAIVERLASGENTGEANDKSARAAAWLSWAVEDGTSLKDAVAATATLEPAYPGIYPNHHQLLVDRGRCFTAAEAVRYGDVVPRREQLTDLYDGNCYQNAYTVAERHGYRYLEGWALLAFDVAGETHRIVVHHAMCYDPTTDKLIEPVWPEVPAEFYGVAISLEQVEDTGERCGSFGVMGNDHLLGYELLTKGLLDVDYSSKSGEGV